MEDRFDGFTVNLYLDEEGDWLAHFVELSHISAFAATPEQALEELEKSIAELSAPPRISVKQAVFEDLKRIFGNDMEILISY
jgi:hypothetical protein